MKITNEMTYRTYEIIKMVYHGNLTRSESKYKIADETGMNALFFLWVNYKYTNKLRKVSEE